MYIFSLIPFSSQNPHQMNIRVSQGHWKLKFIHRTKFFFFRHYVYIITCIYVHIYIEVYISKKHPTKTYSEYSYFARVVYEEYPTEKNLIYNSHVCVRIYAALIYWIRAFYCVIFNNVYKYTFIYVRTHTHIWDGSLRTYKINNLRKKTFLFSVKFFFSMLLLVPFPFPCSFFFLLVCI